jgi:predicted transcriptional regulator
VLRALEDETRADDFLMALDDGQPFDLVERLPDPPASDLTRLHALREMERQGMDALLVVDENRRIRGVISREMVLAQLMLALAE